MTRRTALAVAAVALAVGLGFQGSRGLFETTEGRYAEVGREMLDSGRWLEPTLDHRPHWTKPPPTYWAVAGGVALLGRNAWGARLFNAFALPLAALGVAALGTALWGGREGRVAGLVYATSLFPVVAASTVSTDVLLSAAEVWAVALWWSAARAPDGPGRRRRVIATWAALGAAFLVKGPPGLLSLAALLAYSVVARRRGWPRAPLWSPAGLLAFAAVGLSWYGWAVLSTPGLLGYFLGEEVVARVATDHFGRNPEWWKPALVYGVPLGVGLGVWLLWRPLRALAALRAEARSPAGRAELAFLLVWLALPLAVLTASRSRLPLYVLPFFPALALAFARGQVRAAGASEPTPRGLVPRVALAALVLLGAKAASAHVPSDKDMKPLAAAVADLDPERVVLVDRDGLYGLQFYLDAPVERRAADGAGTPAPSPSVAGRTVFLARDAAALPAALGSGAGACPSEPVPVGSGFLAVRVDRSPGACEGPPRALREVSRAASRHTGSP